MSVLEGPNPDATRVAPKQSELKAKLEGKGLSGRCESCGQTTQWTVADGQYVLTAPDGAEGSRMPVHAIVCGNCGHVRLFNANVLYGQERRSST
jgi:hypothetical protein